MSSYPEASPRKDYYDVVDIFSLGSLRVAELSNGKFVVLTPEEYQQARQGIFQHYASEKHPEGGYTLDQILDSVAGAQGRETYDESTAYNHGMAESFESEPSYSLSAELNRGVRPMKNNNMMMSALALGGAALVGFYFDRIVAVFRGGNGEEEQAAESMQSAANQGFMENWQGGNSGNAADDPRMETKTMQGAVQNEPQVKYNYQPFAGPAQVFHDEATRQKDYFIY